jgi:hypothetical protein
VADHPKGNVVRPCHKILAIPAQVINLLQESQHRFVLLSVQWYELVENAVKVDTGLDLKSRVNFLPFYPMELLPPLLKDLLFLLMAKTHSKLLPLLQRVLTEIVGLKLSRLLEHTYF